MGRRALVGGVLIPVRLFAAYTAGAAIGGAIGFALGLQGWELGALVLLSATPLGFVGALADVRAIEGRKP